MEAGRRSFYGRADWNRLPIHLIEKILLHLGGNEASWDESRTRDVLEMRLVSKAWKAACLGYSGCARILCKQENPLQAVCKMFPSLRILCLQVPADGCITALSSLSRLSQLRLTNGALSTYEGQLDLTCLPSCLKDLSLEPRFKYQQVDFIGLTSLCFIARHNTMREIIGLLQHLPALQCLHVGLMVLEGGLSDDDEIGGIFRCGSLTSLELSCGRLLAPLQSFPTPSALKEIQMADMSIQEESLNVLTSHLTGLTKLQMRHCFTSLAGAVQAAKSVRSLRLRVTTSDLLFLAGSNVEALTFGDLIGPINLSHFTTFSALKQLTLLSVTAPEPAEMRPLCQLGVQELRLYNCSGVAEALFVPGSLPALQAFAFEESRSCLWDGAYMWTAAAWSPEELSVEAATPQAQQLGRAVFGHASLLRLSGKSRLSYVDPPVGWVRQGESCAERVAI